VLACWAGAGQFHLAHGFNRFALKRKIATVCVPNRVTSSATNSDKQVWWERDRSGLVNNQFPVLAEVFNVDVSTVFSNKPSVPQFE
jgi:hypothetical protein